MQIGFVSPKSLATAFFGSGLLALLPVPLLGQDTEPAESTAPDPALEQAEQAEDNKETPKASRLHLDLGYRETGLSLGNSPRWTGLRINFSDHYVERVHGVNLTLGQPRENPDFQMNGLSLGLVAPGADRLNGLSLGLAACVGNGMNGVQAGGLALVCGGNLRGVNVSTLANVSKGKSQGLQLSGVALVSDGGLQGVNVGGLASVSGGGTDGITASGLANVASGPMRGLQFAGLASVAAGGMRGVTVSGLANVAEKSVQGLSVAGLASVAETRHRGIGVAGLAIVGGESCFGVNVAGLAVVAGTSIRGIQLAGALIGKGDVQFWSSIDANDTDLLQGLSFGGFQIRAAKAVGVQMTLGSLRAKDLQGFHVGALVHAEERQRGFSLALFNYAESLRGFQIGLINYCGDNPVPFRWLPLFNFSA